MVFIKKILDIKIPHSLDYNPYLDGLRGLSILLVVLFHFFPSYFSFGFIGVDIFFILSGFLITTIILNKLENNSFSIKEFYRNRARRLFPSLIVLLISSLAIGFLFLFPSEYKDLARHVKSSALYYENFRLINDTGYWDKDATLKPLLHIWSLSIEEQFYIFWSIFLILIYKIKRYFAIILLILFLFFFSISVLVSIKSPEVAFFHTITRVWELIFGGLLTLIVRKYNWFNYIVKFKNLIPIVLFISIILLLSKQSSYNPIKIFFILSMTALWILIVYKKEKKDFILGNKFLITLGLISYSLYLWHYTVLSFLHIFGYTEIYYLLGGLLISILLSILTFRFIEVPFRRRNDYKTAIFLTIFLIIIGFVGQYIYVKRGLPERLNILLKDEKEILNKFNFGQRYDDNCKSILINNKLDQSLIGYCRATTKDLDNIKGAVLGDSHSLGVYEGLRNILSEKPINIILLGRDGCLPYINSATGDYPKKHDHIKCLNKNKQTYALLDKMNNLKAVILSSRIAHYITGKGYGDTEKGQNKLVFIEYFKNKDRYNQRQIFLKHLKETFEYFNKRKIHVFLVLENPELGFSPKICLRRFIIPNPRENNCVLPVKEYIKRRSSYLEDIKKLSEKYKYVHIIDVKDTFCDNQFCYLYEDKIPLYFDDDHLTIYGGKKVVNSFYKELLKYLNY